MGIKFDTYWKDSLETFHYIKRGKSIRVWLLVSFFFFFFFGKYFSSIITMHIESYWLGILKINTACHFMVISEEHELCSIVCPSPYKHLEKKLFLLMSLVAYVQAKYCFVLWLSLNGWQIWEWNLTRCPALSKASFSSRTKYKSVILWIVMKLCTWSNKLVSKWHEPPASIIGPDLLHAFKKKSGHFIKHGTIFPPTYRKERKNIYTWKLFLLGFGKLTLMQGGNLLKCWEQLITASIRCHFK